MPKYRHDLLALLFTSEEWLKNNRIRKTREKHVLCKKNLHKKELGEIRGLCPKHGTKGVANLRHVLLTFQQASPYLVILSW